MSELEPRVWPQNTELNQHGEMVLGGIAVSDLVQEFGTPLFVIDELDVKNRIKQYVAAYSDAPMPVKIHYASKAFASADVLRWMVEGGLGVDVASGGELALALAAGVPANLIVMHGNNKSMAELERGINAGVSAIVIDSFDEIERLNRICKSLNKNIDVFIRLTVGVEAHTHEFISTAHEDQKFGLSVSSGAAEHAAVEVNASPHLNLLGFHSHIGSQIFDPKGFEVSAARVIEFCALLFKKYSFITQEVDLGGGTGIAYLPTDDPMSIADMAKAIIDVVVREVEKHKIKLPTLSIEPGRSIIGQSTVTLYEVGTIKPIELEDGSTRTYISVDGGMSDNIRTALYSAEYTARIANRDPLGGLVQSRIVGKHCESGDIVVRDLQMASDVAPGDLIAVAATGAYHRSMASNYNMLTKPAVVAVKHENAQLLVRRETDSDLLALDQGLI